jgi:hypothetical protein
MWIIVGVCVAISAEDNFIREKHFRAQLLVLKQPTGEVFTFKVIIW